MIAIPKKKISAHLRSLHKKMRQIERDAELLRRWAKSSKQLPAQRLAFILKDGVEDLNSGLMDLQTIIEKAFVT